MFFSVALERSGDGDHSGIGINYILRILFQQLSDRRSEGIITLFSCVI